VFKPGKWVKAIRADQQRVEDDVEDMDLRDAIMVTEVPDFEGESVTFSKEFIDDIRCM
jgi:hypothetical protein